MLKLCATTILRYTSASGTPWVSTRLEVGWSDGQWSDLGLSHLEESDWSLLVRLLALGARRADVEFTHVEYKS